MVLHIPEEVPNISEPLTSRLPGREPRLIFEPLRTLPTLVAAPSANGEEKGPLKAGAAGPEATVRRVEEALGAGPQPEGRSVAAPSSFELQMLDRAEALGKGKSEAECFALKRPGGPLEARIKSPDAPCDFTCVLMLAGGVHRSLPAGTRVVLTGMVLRNRMAPNVSQEARDTLPERYGEQFLEVLRRGAAPAA